MAEAQQTKTGPFEHLVPTDPLMALAWWPALLWAVGSEARTAFEEESGMRFVPAASAIEAMIDRATGNDGADYIVAFAEWFNRTIWGDGSDPEDWCNDMAVRAALAEIAESDRQVSTLPPPARP